MRTLITGVTGFVGSHLAELLLGQGVEVTGLCRRAAWPGESEFLSSRVPLDAADVSDGQRVREILRQRKPDQVYHVAGFANVAQSFVDPKGAYQSNVVGSRELFDAVAEVVPSAKVLYVGSGLVYGQPPADELPITEETRLRPASPYAEGKAAADELARTYAREGKLNVVVVRTFNLIGPRQQSSYAIANFARQIAEFERSEQPAMLRVGRLDVERDFTDVRDGVRAYQAVMAKGGSGEVFNIASGQTHLVRELLDGLIRISGREIEVVQDPDLLRNDEPKLMVSPRALRERTGWEPNWTIEQTLRDILNDWRQRIRGSDGSHDGVDAS